MAKLFSRAKQNSGFYAQKLVWQNLDRLHFFWPPLHFFVAWLHVGTPIEEHPRNLTILMSQHFTSNSLIARECLFQSFYFFHDVPLG